MVRAGKKEKILSRTFLYTASKNLLLTFPHRFKMCGQRLTANHITLIAAQPSVIRNDLSEEWCNLPVKIISFIIKWVMTVTQFWV